ncbi:MAG: hypothetical protein Q9162_005834 [Coniocarpon cinnabarinum]
MALCGGLCFALALGDQNISSTIYEARSSLINLSGGVVLSPNALRILQRLGVYERLLHQGYQFENSDIVNEKGEILDRHYYGHERAYGYKALRIARHALVQELYRTIQTRNVRVIGDARCTEIFSDAGDGVTFRVNGQLKTASMLIATDGVHSTLRRHINDTPLKYTGITGVTSIIPRNEIRWSKENHPAAAVVRGEPGALLLVSEDPLAITTMAAIQRQHPELDRAGWDTLPADKHDDTLLLWPFYAVPSMPTWSSQTRRVVLVGDAAHAVPPSSGQGISQAIEDAYSLAYLLGAKGGSIPLTRLVDFWQQWRQNRIKETEHVVNITNIKRMSEAERKKHTDVPEEDLDKVQTATGQYAWLFNMQMDEELAKWIATQ